MRCVVPAGVVIPLHSHPDPEAYYVLEGALEVLQHDGSSGYWLTSERGETVSIPGNVQHAIRNLSDWSAEILLISTPNIYEFFRELGKPVNAEQPPALPTPDDLQRLQQLSERYNYWLASPEENAAIGLAISKGA
jgi:Cupin domain